MPKFSFFRYVPEYDEKGHLVGYKEVLFCDNQTDKATMLKEIEMYAPPYFAKLEEEKQLATQRLVTMETRIDELEEENKKLLERLIKVERLLDNKIEEELTGGIENA